MSVTSEKEAWDHFCKVLELEEAQRQLLEGEEIKSTGGHYYILGLDMGITAVSPSSTASA
jgi:hypothetical protein